MNEERFESERRDYEDWLEHLRQGSERAAEQDYWEELGAWREATIKVDSSVMSAVAWMGDHFRVLLTNGKGVDYANVSRRWFDALLAAPSKGRFMVALKIHQDDFPVRDLTADEIEAMSGA